MDTSVGRLTPNNYWIEIRRKLQYGLNMKRLTILLVIFSMTLPSPAQGFLNRDCSNLKKRVGANQVKYERAWDKYQTALGKYQAIKDPPVGADQEVANRLRVTYTAIEVILQDMGKYPKCLSKPLVTIGKNLSDVQRFKKEYVFFRFGSGPLPEIFDFRTYLK